MSTVSITSVADLANARNTLRKEILAQEWPPVLCVRAVAALTSLGELILKSHITGTLEIMIVSQQGNKGVQIEGFIPRNIAEDLVLAQKQLDRAVDSIEIEDNDNLLHISIYCGSPVK